MSSSVRLRVRILIDCLFIRAFQMMSQQRYLEHEQAQHIRVMGEYKDLLESHAKLRTDTTKV